MSDFSLSHHSTLTPDDVSDLQQLLAAVTEADGVRPLSEHVWLHVTHGGDERAEHLFVRGADSTLVGYAHLDMTDQVDGPSAELAVHPTFRQQAIGRQLVQELLAISDGRLRLWAHSERTPATRLAETMGFERHRVLWQMRRSLHALLPEAHFPDGITVEPFAVDRDEVPFLELNAQAFADLPDQSSWELEDLRRRETEDWFDPSGFLMAWAHTDDDSQHPTLAGFHWTKVHGGHEHDGAHSHGAIGEVYVLAVNPNWHGTGLGRALTLAGLHHLRRLGLDQVMLYVDASNVTAIRLYEGLGFVRWDTDVMYRIILHGSA